MDEQEDIILWTAVSDIHGEYTEARTLVGQGDRKRRNAQAYGLDFLRRSLKIVASIG